MRLIRSLIGIGVLCTALVIGLRIYLDDQLAKPVAVTTVDVPMGTPAQAVLKILAPELSGVLGSLIFRLHPELTGLQAGRYAFVADLTVFDALNAIAAGDAIQNRWTIPEGIRSRDLLSRLAEDSLFVESVPDAEALTDLLETGFPHPEGAFLAETYVWKQQLSRREFLELAHQALRVELDTAWANRTAAVSEVLQSPYELLILASIVEKETAVAAERPRIAGVFIERLRRGMRLQTDPTVIYGLGERFDGNLTRRHLREQTPYNTYRIAGLPPTPIAIVGPDALHAVAAPLITGELYFVADGQGAHVFSKTLDEHNANVRRYQLKR